MRAAGKPGKPSLPASGEQKCNTLFCIVTFLRNRSDSITYLHLADLLELSKKKWYDENRAK